MKRRLVLLAAVVIGSGCAPSVDPAPANRVAFNSEGAAYEWQLAHGSSGSLMLVRLDDIGRGRPQVMITCDDRQTGGLQFRGALAGDGALSASTPDARFVVDAVAVDGFDTAVAQGAGRFPSGWFRALAATNVVRFESSEAVFETPAPGAAAVGHLERYCRTLG